MAQKVIRSMLHKQLGVAHFPSLSIHPSPIDMPRGSLWNLDLTLSPPPYFLLITVSQAAPPLRLHHPKPVRFFPPVALKSSPSAAPPAEEHSRDPQPALRQEHKSQTKLHHLPDPAHSSSRSKIRSLRSLSLLTSRLAMSLMFSSPSETR